MNLPERRGGEGHFLNRDEPVEELATELALNDAAYVDEGFSWDFVLESCQLFGDFLGQDIHPRREELADLDEHAAHLDGERSEACGDLTQAFRSRAFCATPQPDLVEEPFPSDELERHDRKEEHNPAISVRRRHAGLRYYKF